MKSQPNSSIEQVKSLIRQPYAWPGMYPKYAVCTDGAALCCKCVASEYKLIAGSTIQGDKNGGWNVAAVDVNWENEDLICDHCNKAIESAYGETDEEMTE